MNLEDLQRKAERGDVKAQYWLGWMHYRGCYIEDRNMWLASKWIQRAAKNGHAGAQYQVGLWLKDIWNVYSDVIEAAKWIEKAAKQGHAAAQYQLGEMYYDGDGVMQSKAKAEKWWRLAAKQGHAGAQYQIGKMYYEGVGVERSDAEAFKWWRMLPKTNPCDVVRWLEEEELRERLGF